MMSLIRHLRARPRLRRVLVWSSGALAAAGLGFFAYMKAVEGAWIRYNEWDRRERGTLRVGHQAPDLELPLVDAGSVRFSELWRERPVVLIFGSCT
ncbi:MAG TPA: hypothetical protein VII13_16440 [Vicinamibacteria bacterium]|jgi:hypothetical protein